MKLKKFNNSFIFLFVLFFFNNSFAQAEGVPKSLIDYNIFFILLILFFVAASFGYFGTEKERDHFQKISIFFKKARSKYFTGLAPIENEKDLLMDHDYDGIKELDSRIPPWFNYLFYGTILFGIYYMIDYHVIGTGLLPKQEYEEEMRIAAVQRDELIRSGAFLNENNVTLLNDESSLSKGRNIFMTNCKPCHGEFLQGAVGPNLTDEYWIHGGGVKNLFKTVKYGVPAKGMISWQNSLDPTQIQEVVSFVISMKGSNPPNAKPPEGEKYVEQDSTKIFKRK